ncbi:MAG: ABC transporter substrate-binding protein, partial [Propionicimonas sp.]|nr:ABC transporter substrate-binding protein [Propionicimonas sp.]
TGLGNGWTPDHSLELQYATKFSVDFYDGDQAPCPDRENLAACEARQYALVSISDGNRYLVVPQGRPVPEGIGDGVTVLPLPLTNLYLAASSTMSLVVALDALDAVRFSSLAADRWYIPEAKAAMDAGQILFGGKYSAPDYELILKSDPSLAIENGMIYHTPEVKEKLEALGIPVLVEQSSYESHPLGRSEWIKLFGVLLGREQLADTLFDAQAAHLEELAGQPDTGKTVAFFSISSAGYVVARKSGDYVPKMIGLAGGDYVFSNLGDDTATSTVNLEMEQFYATAKDADYIVYNATISGQLQSLADLTALNPLLKDFKAVRQGNVWCTDQDFYQDMTGLGQMITDLHQMLTDPEVPDQLTFLHRLR